jgi:hypothetical protein
MICVSLAGSLLIGIACGEDRLTAPERIGRAIETNRVATPPSFGPDSIQIAYECGRKFYIRSAHDSAYTVKWVARGKWPVADSAVLTLPPRIAGQLFSATLISSGVDLNWVQAFSVATGVVVAHKQVTTVPCASVPALPPTTDPRPVFDSLGKIPATMLGTDSAVANVIAILFKATASQAARQYAVDLVSGVVVAGLRVYPSGDGWYYVRLPGLPTAGTIGRALQKLDTLTTISSVRPVSSTSTGPSHLNRPGVYRRLGYVSAATVT